jgi:hypothetical protein
LTAVHVADALLQDDDRLHENYLTALNLEQRLPVWRALAASAQAGEAL